MTIKSERWKIDFVAVGPMKTGTSWLHEYFASNQDISVPVTVKETYYFSSGYHKSIEWYKRQFSNHDCKIRGEVCPTYFPDLEAMQRLRDHNPDIKIIVTLREPVARFLSHFHHSVSAGFIDPSLLSYYSAYTNRRIIRDHSSYNTYLINWFEIFGSDNIKIVFYEDLKTTPQEFVNVCCEFLGIEKYSIPVSLTKPVGKRRDAKNPSILKLAKSSAKWLREKELHFIVNFIRKNKVDSLLYQKNFNKNRAITNLKKDDQIEQLFLAMKDEVIPLESCWGVDIDRWRSEWLKQGLHE